MVEVKPELKLTPEMITTGLRVQCIVDTRVHPYLQQYNGKTAVITRIIDHYPHYIRCQLTWDDPSLTNGIWNEVHQHFQLCDLKQVAEQIEKKKRHEHAMKYL